jgi:hypothetical protein
VIRTSGKRIGSAQCPNAFSEKGIGGRRGIAFIHEGHARQLRDYIVFAQIHAFSG